MAADELEGLAKAKRREKRNSPDDNYLVAQFDFDGNMDMHAWYDKTSAPTVLNAIDDAAGPPASNDTNSCDGDDQDGETDPGRPTDRNKQRADGLLKLAESWLGGGSDKRARPSMIINVDLSDISVTAAGTIQLAAFSGMPTVTVATLERLARDADMRAVLFDGARPLAVSDKTNAENIPVDIRRAVKGRDKGCRMPGSSYPAAWTDIHHLTPQAQGGDHHPDNLAALARIYHQGTVHEHGWTTHLDPATGAFTITRGDVSYSSLPNGTHLKHPNTGDHCDQQDGDRTSNDNDGESGRDPPET